MYTNVFSKKLAKIALLKSRRTAAKEKDPDILRMEQELSERLGAPVEVEHQGKRGRLMIRFHSLEELEGILEHIR